MSVTLEKVSSEMWTIFGIIHGHRFPVDSSDDNNVEMTIIQVAKCNW